MGGHAKAVCCISSEPAGNRLITGSLDYTIKIYDFGGMDRYGLLLRCSCFLSSSVV